MKISVEFVLNDFWVGLYYRFDKAYGLRHFYICIIPCLPIHITFDVVRQQATKLAPIISKGLEALNEKDSNK